MRSFENVKSRVSVIRLVTALLLASAATGCSTTRFDGFFSSDTDRVTTNSISRQTPVPREDVADADGGTNGLNQTYNGGVYDQVSTSTTDSAPSRRRVERAELSTPGDAGRTQRVASIDPAPARRETVLVRPDVEEQSVRNHPGKSAWKVTDDSPRVMIKSGQTLSGLADKYNVPQAEILRANNMESASDLKYGRTIVIPVSSKVASKHRDDASEKVASRNERKIPVPRESRNGGDAVLADKGKRDKLKGGDAVADGSQYVVKEGDSLAKIAREHKVSVDALKKANGMNTASLRIGQKIAIPTGKEGADAVRTASIPAESEVKRVSESKPTTHTPPVEEKSVADVQKSSDDGEDAPDATGIGKYRWPVRGAVIASYGQNVEGTRSAGIDISVPEGTPVKAAENGVVIYAGSGLKDLGNTVLVRHDDGTVTVYGNASNLNVKRGDKVTRGQVVASSGMTGGAKRPKVHFEVRKNSVPVNPMTFLQ